MFTIQKKFIPITVCLAFGLAACGSDSKSSTTDAAVTTVADTTGVTDTTGATDTSVDDSTETSVDDSSGGADVVLTQSTFGPILSDGAGNTLYSYNPDGADTPTCSGGCAGAWPAYVTDEDHVSVGDGLDEGLFKIVDGPNGPQISFNGHPLYFFSGDSAPGDTNGQGSGGVWFILDADGNQITA